MKMKKMILSIVALLSMTVAMAQNNSNSRPQPPKKMTHTEMTTEMASKLKLTADQKTKVAALNKEYEDYLQGPGPGGPGGPGKNGGPGQEAQGKGNSPKGNASGSNDRQEPPKMTDAQKKQMKQHQAKRQEYDKKLKQILTDDQYKSWKKHHGRHGGPRGGHRPQKPAND